MSHPQEEITAAEAAKLLKENEKLFDKRVVGHLEIATRVAVNTIFNCTFDDVRLEFARNINFSQCRFNSFEYRNSIGKPTKWLEFNQCQWMGPAGLILGSGRLLCCLVANCELPAIRVAEAEMKRLRVTGGKVTGIDISDSTISDMVSIHSAKVGRISFKNSTVKDNISIEDISGCAHVELSYCKTAWGRICQSTISRIDLIETTFSERCGIWMVEMEEGIMMVDVECKEEFRLQALVSPFDAEDSISGGLPGFEPPRIEIQGGSFKAGFLWFSDPMLDLKGNFKKHDPAQDLFDFTITKSTLGQGVIEVREICLNSVLLDGHQGFELVALHYCAVQQAMWNEYSTSGRCRVFDGHWPEGSPNFLIQNSNVGAMEWFGMDLSNSNIGIANSVVTDLVTASIVWPKEINLTEVVDETRTIKQWVNLRETYRQLKYAMQKQGNHIQALRFKALEHETHCSELKHTGRKGDRWDSRLLWSNRSNKHGLDWRRPIKYLFWANVLAGIIYCFGTVAVYGHSLNCWSTVWHVFRTHWGEFFTILNPTHRFDLLFREGDVTHTSHAYNTLQAVDYFYRLVVSYFIFQTISAFRKYAK